MTQKEKDHQKSELISDLLATNTVMEEVWRYHPDNPGKKDVVKEYNILQQIQSDIEKELAELDK
jgi:predicted secreted protein